MSLPAYPAYKESGVEWLGEIPSAWKLVPLKRFSWFNYGDALPTDIRDEEGNIGVYGSNGLLGSHSHPNTSSPVIIIGRKGSSGALNWSEVPVLVIDTAYFADEVRSGFDLRWLYWSLHPARLSDFSQDTGVPGLARELVHNMLFAVPDPITQSLVASFLDRETAKIDALVAEQERLIGLLKEKRQAIISHAVTKGLDPNVPMKDSGVKWLGKVPAHWEIRKTSHLFRAGKGKNGQQLTREYCYDHEGEYPVYSGQTENDGLMGTLDRYEFDFGDTGVLFSTTVGAKAMDLRHVFGKFSLSQNCMIIWPRHKSCDVRFYFYHFQPLFKFQRELIPDHMQASFRIEDLNGYHVALPPPAEQRQIASHLDRCVHDLELLAEEAAHAIALLRERRSALISAAVTGKIDVAALLQPSKRPHEHPQGIRLRRRHMRLPSWPRVALPAKVC